MSYRGWTRTLFLIGVIAGSMWSLTGIASAAPAAAPTFTKDVAPILFKSCIVCHRPGEVAPMSLLTYEDARPWAKAIRRKVAAREMPPWFADAATSSLKFRNDRRLSQQEVDTILAWVDAGAPKGSEKDMPALPQFTAGWEHPKGLPPDYIVEMPVEFSVPAEGEIPMSTFYLPGPFKEDRFAESIQVRPGNRKAVHHIMYGVEKLSPDVRVENSILIDAKTGKPFSQRAEAGTNEERIRRTRDVGAIDTDTYTWLATYTPGWTFENYAPGVGKRIPAGWHNWFGMHYQASGKPEKDRSVAGLWFQRVPLTHELHIERIGNAATLVEGKELVPDTASQVGPLRRPRLPNIPPYAENWAITTVTAFDKDVTIYAFTPHMHLRGHDMKYVAVYPDGREETVLNVPKYDFNWQLFYEPEKPLKLPAGSKIMAIGHYDNSAKNKFNPAPDKEVFWSEQSWDEMYNAFIHVSVDSEDPTKQPARSQEQQQQQQPH